jgi:alkylation response protein AidB-like acyl-CoA dehydrogenase
LEARNQSYSHHGRHFTKRQRNLSIMTPMHFLPRRYETDTGPLDEIIALLREEGFFYAGYLPEYGGRDWITLQRVTHLPIDRASVKLADEHCYGLLDFIISDQR